MVIVACRVLQGNTTGQQDPSAAVALDAARLPRFAGCPPVILQRQLADHLCGILRGALHGRHARGLLTAIVLQQGIVQGLQQKAFWLMRLLGILLVLPGHCPVPGGILSYCKSTSPNDGPVRQAAGAALMLTSLLKAGCPAAKHSSMRRQQLVKLFWAVPDHGHWTLAGKGAQTLLNAAQMQLSQAPHGLCPCWQQ